MPKETLYFSHDYNSRSDPKIRRLLMKHGMAGYGVFWAIIEELYQNTNVLPTYYDGMAYEFHSDEKTVKSIINDFDLFKIDGENFSSDSVKRRLEFKNYKSLKAKESIAKRWNIPDTNVSINDTNVSNQDTNVSPLDTNIILKESKVKESKVKKITLR